VQPKETYLLHFGCSDGTEPPPTEKTAADTVRKIMRVLIQNASNILGNELSRTNDIVAYF
jgi:hypothetical protein